MVFVQPYLSLRTKTSSRAFSGKEVTQLWLKQNIIIPAAAADPPQRKLRIRPLIFVYDTPSEYNSRMLQYRCNVCHVSVESQIQSSLELKAIASVVVYYNDESLVDIAQDQLHPILRKPIGFDLIWNGRAEGSRIESMNPRQP